MQTGCTVGRQEACQRGLGLRGDHHGLGRKRSADSADHDSGNGSAEPPRHPEIRLAVHHWSRVGPLYIPIITSITKEVLQAVPVSQKEAAYALGATRWEMVRVALIPYARSGVLGAVILGLGRAIGETMAVTMVIGNTPQISLSLLAPGYTMPSVIANEFAETTSKLHSSALMEIGLILLVVTLIINALARLLIWSVTRGDTGARA